MSEKVQGIVFDVGGTLICPAEPVGETYVKFAETYGVSLHADALEAAFILAFKSCSPRGTGLVPTDGNDRAWWRRVVGLSLPENLFEPEVFESFFEAVYVHFEQPEAWELFPEVRDVLQALRDHPVELAVLSNWDSRLHNVLDGLGIGEVFTQRFVSAELGREKPDPGIYRHVADKMRLKPGSLLSVGDDERNDVEAPLKEGWHAIKIARPHCDLWAVLDALKGR